MKIKYALLTILLSATSGVLVAQSSISPQGPPVLVYGNASDPLIEASFGVQNTGTSPLDIKVERFEISVVSGSANNICWGIACYPDQTSLTPDAQTIQPGATDYTFKADYKPHNTTGTSTIKYCFFDVNNPGDSSCVVLKFQTGVTGINQQQVKTDYSIHPNPARSMVTLTHNIAPAAGNARIIIRDMLGKTVKEVVIDPSNQIIAFNVEDLQPGIYFYTLAQQGLQGKAKRLVVTR